MRNTARLRRLVSALGWAPEPVRDEIAERRRTPERRAAERRATERRAEVDRWLDDAPEADPATGSAGPGLSREQIVALLVPETGESTFRLRAVPGAQALPDEVPDGAGSIYRTHDGRIVLDWHRAS